MDNIKSTIVEASYRQIGCLSIEPENSCKSCL